MGLDFLLFRLREIKGDGWGNGWCMEVCFQAVSVRFPVTDGTLRWEHDHSGDRVTNLLWK